MSPRPVSLSTALYAQWPIGTLTETLAADGLTRKKQHSRAIRRAERLSIIGSV
jgi:hypothetical protein